MTRFAVCFGFVFSLGYSASVVDALAQGQNGVYESGDLGVELTGHQKCYVRGISTATIEIVTWNGHCSDGLAQGFGTLTWFRDSVQGEKTRLEIGFLREGRKHGHWIERMGKGDGLRIEDGFYEMGKKHGQWIEQSGKGFGLRIETGTYELGKKHGRWIERSGKGNGLRIEDGFYEMGKKHGLWVEHTGKGSNSHVAYRTYEHGENTRMESKSRLDPMK